MRTNMESADLKKMNGLFARSGINLTREQLERFALFYDMLAANEKADLTRLRSLEDIVIKHFVDSVYFTRLVSLPSSLIDIGTGAGFPGIPLKIMNPHIALILAEPKAKRAAFLNAAVGELGLENVSVYPHSVTDKSFFDVEGVITRALESAEDTLARTDHFLRRGGMVLLMKGPEADRDISSLGEENKSRFSLAADKSYVLPATSYARRILVFKKTAEDRKRTHRILKNRSETVGTIIASADNRTFRELKSLSGSQGIKKTGSMLAAGRKLVTELIKNPAVGKRRLIIYDGCTEKDPELNGLYEEYAEAGKLFILKRSLFNEIDIFKAEGPLLQTDLPQIDEWQEENKRGCFLAVPFQDPQNVGSAVRSAASFDASGVIILKEAALPFHPKAVRASAGTIFRIPLFAGPAVSEFISRASKIPIIPLDKSGRDIADFTFPETFCLLPGPEGPGLPASARAGAAALPISKNAESLNGAVAASIALYEWSKRRRRQAPQQSGGLDIV